MDSSVLKDIIVKDILNLPRFMIFIEEEHLNAKSYINMIGKKLGLEIELYDSADDAIFEITSPLATNKIYYILNDTGMMKKIDVISFLKSCGSYVILGFENVKPNDSFFEENKQFTYTFKRGNTNDLLSYVKKKYNIPFLSDIEIYSVIAYSDNRLSQICNEFDKITLLSDNEAKLYVENKCYPDIREIDNMAVMQMILRRDKTAIQYSKILEQNAVQSLLAIYTMARKRFVSDNNQYYAKLMILCFKAHSSIIDGTENSQNAIKKFLIDLF